MDTNALVSASTALSQAVTVAASNAGLLVSLHDTMIAELRNVLAMAQTLELELAETKSALKKAEAELAALKAEPCEVMVAPCEEAHLD